LESTGGLMSTEAILVTGATGALGSKIVLSLLQKAPQAKVIAGARNPEKAAALAAKGAEIRLLDYDKPETIEAAMKGVTRVVLVSGNDVGRRVPQHKAVIDAAKRAGVKLLGYTSILRATESPLLLAQEHRGTEEALAASGLAHILLRHGWYTENSTNTAPLAVKFGVVQSCAGDGRFSTATRQDYADGDAALILKDGHAPGQRYELAGSTSFSRGEYAALLSRKSGSPVKYQAMSQADHAAALVAAGLPPPIANIISDSDAGASKGWLQDDSRTLEKVLGRPTTSLEQVVEETLKESRS
jgi:NAD(P)H dehydrogenase (quinone)